MAENEGSPDERLSPRERRAQRAQEKQGPTSSVDWKRYRGHAIIILIAAGVLAGIIVNAKYGKDCPGHWHGIMDVYVDGDELSFAAPGFTLEGSGTPLSAHMHQSEVQRGNNQIHFEPNPPECQDFAAFLGYVDIDMDGDSITLDGDHAQANEEHLGTHTENATHQLRAYHKTWGDDWESIGVGRLNGRQLSDGEAVLIVFGNETDAEIQAYQESVESLDPALTPRGGGSDFPLVPVIGVSIIALVVLLVWNNLRRKM